jgi:hypothetical protein
MRVSHTRRGRCFVGVAAWVAAILLTIFGPAQKASSAQTKSTCGQSTVEDAWGANFASEAKLFLDQLQRVVRDKDKAKLASLIEYPVRINVGSHHSEIASEKEFLRKYSSVLTPDMVREVLAQMPDCLFGNSQGVMIGRGVIWFQRQPEGTMKIIAFNIPSSDAR